MFSGRCQVLARKVFTRARLRVGSALRAAHRWMDGAFYQLGCFASDHSLLVLSVSFIVALALSTGLLKLKPEDRYDKLWATPGSEVDSANAAFAKYFSTPSQPAQVIVTSAHHGVHATAEHDRDNVLNEAILLETLRLHETVLLVLGDGLRGACQPVDNFLASAQEASRQEYLKVQSLDVSDCPNVNGVLSAFGYNSETIRRNANNISGTILQYFSPSVRPRHPAALYVGNVQVPADDLLRTSPAFRLVYTVDAKFVEDFALDKLFVDTVEEFSSNSVLISAKALGPASLDRETERSLSSDFWLVGISGSVLVLFSVLNAGNMICCDPLRSRTLVALCGMLNVALALGASIGLVTYCGVMFSAIQVAMICVILAIGVDDMFVLCDALARQDPRLPRRERVGGALRQVGASIAMTSTTDAITFALVAINAVPGVEAFAINATVAVIVDFVLQVTFFVACLALDEQRVDSGRAEILCCIMVDRSAESTAAAVKLGHSSVASSECGNDSESSPTNHTTSASTPANAQAGNGVSKPKSSSSSMQPFLAPHCVAVQESVFISPARTPPSSCRRRPGEKYLTYVFREKYGPFVVRSRLLKVLVVVLLVVLCGVSVYGLTRVSSELKLSDTLVDSSFVLQYQELETMHFSSVSVQVEMVILPKDSAAESTQLHLRSLSSSLESSPSFHPYVVSWFDELCQYATACNQTLPNGLLPHDEFSMLLHRFFNTSLGRRFRHDVVLGSAAGKTFVEAARITAWQRSSPSTHVLLQRMALSQDIASQSSADLTVHAYSYVYRFLHQVQLVKSSGYQTVLLSLVVVMIISWFFFEGSLVGALLCTLLIAIVNFNLFGLMPFLGLEYNHASHTVLVIGIGFSVDYVAHLVLAFAKAKGNPDERVVIALTQMGSSIFSGSLTTFLGLIALVFGSVEISRIFAKLICLLISLSAFYGLVLSPIVLLYIGRKWKPITPREQEEGEVARPATAETRATSDILPVFYQVGDRGEATNTSLPQLHPDPLKPPVAVTENDSKAPLSISLTTLTSSPAKHKANRPKKSHSMRVLSNSHGASQDFHPLYKAVKINSNGVVGRSASMHTNLPHSGSVRCESSL
eukprot:scpid9671/ scgid20192/ Niemann-Pick C1 protein